MTHKGEGKAIDSSTVVIRHYTVWLSNGDTLDASRDRTLNHNYKQDSIPKIQQSIEKFNELKKGGFKDIWVDTYAINDIGYGLLRRKRVSETLEIFKINTIEYPNSFNAYDSLSEAYMKLGRTELAILNYKKSLELNSENKNA